MKKLALVLALSLTLLLLPTACSFEERLEKPPAAFVLCGEQELRPEIHDDSWEYKNLDGSVSSYITDGIGVINTKKEAVSTAESIAAIRFDTEPQSVYVECFPEEKRGDTAAQGQYLHVQNNQFSLRSGSYIYAIHASWRAKRYSGDCTYVVVIDSTAEEPILKKPPVLTVACEGKTTAAKLGTYSWTCREGDQAVTTNADSSHPLTLLTEEDRLDFKEGKVSLHFETEPDRMESYCWNDTELGKNVGGNNITDYWSANYRMDSAYGGYIVEIRAYWNRDGYEGNANYCFYINKQQ